MKYKAYNESIKEGEKLVNDMLKYSNLAGLKVTGKDTMKIDRNYRTLSLLVGPALGSVIIRSKGEPTYIRTKRYKVRN